jgi:hypothetical protein
MLSGGVVIFLTSYKCLARGSPGEGPGAYADRLIVKADLEEDAAFFMGECFL